MTELKELKGNQLSVTGTLAEKSLEFATDRDGNEIIKGYIPSSSLLYVFVMFNFIFPNPFNI